MEDKQLTENQISGLKQLEKKPKELYEKLISWLKNKEITVDGLINFCQEKKINISGKVVNQIGLVYGQGKNEITKDSNSAFKLYQFAADELKYTSAYVNCAQYYFDGRATGGVNLEQALIYCDQAIEPSQKSRYLLKAQILFKQNQYDEALEALNSVSETKEIKDQLNILKANILFQKGDYYAALQSIKQVEKIKEVEKFRKSLGEHLTKHLEELYTKVEKNKPNEEIFTKKSGEEINNSSLLKIENSPNQKIEENNQNQKIPNEKSLPGWFPLSEALDGFDIDKCDELTAQIELVNLQLKIAETSLELAEKQLESAKEKKSSNKILNLLEQEVKKLENTKNEISKKQQELQEAYEKYTNSTNKVMQRQYQTELRFFNPRRTKSQETHKFALELEKRRVSQAEISEAINVDNQPSRRLITGERSTVECSIEALDLYKKTNYHGYIEDIGWVGDPNKKGFAFNEKIKMSDTEIQYQQQTGPHINHLGNFYNHNLQTYQKIVSKLRKVTGTDEKINAENEKKLAQCMLDFCKHGTPLTLQKLQEINSQATKEQVKQLNEIFYHCFVKEPARWMLPRDEENQLPMATAQIRALQLIIKGYLTIAEVFGQDARYGVYTGKEIGKNIGLVREKIIKINRLYDEAILKQDQNSFSPYISFFKNHPNGAILPTRKQLHQELKQTFGGDEDTDSSEGYESDGEKERLYNVFDK